MADPEQVARLKAGVEGWNAWRKENPGGRIDLQFANLRSAYLQSADLESANLQSADVRGAVLQSANLRSANLQSANLQRVDLRRAYLQSADLQSADLQSADLESAFLKSAFLKSANIESANLQSADLQSADLRSANLQGAYIQSAYLRGAIFQSANLQRVDLRSASLEDANLQSADLQSANLRSVRLLGAVLRSTVLGDVDLRRIEGLEQVVHEGPSIVDHRNLAKSQGRIPAVFLRGCGFQDWEIEAAKLHAPNLSEEAVNDIVYEVARLKGRSPIQINPVFISYSRDDSAFVEAIEPFLDDKGIRYWRDVHDMTAGPLDEQIERAIRLNPTYLLVLSERSIESDWVEWEAQKARDLEKELRRQGDHRHVLCPVALDESWKDATWSGHLKHQIEKYNILDFSQWRDEEVLEGMFSRLLEGLGIYYRSEF